MTVCNSLTLGPMDICNYNASGFHLWCVCVCGGGGGGGWVDRIPPLGKRTLVLAPALLSKENGGDETIIIIMQ